ncbi:nicotinate-nucleotide adenylyltransferase [Shimia sagamensis]|uniref:Probable nicotinate-nucleotide adenylyltransferase n=1 Tax=Shimia sagamensis TaxID=1566352 RepID=A0ABY1P7Y6_9RHOB|nr:nicotinate-nucleotide adenylyltransferase [Shimia sagamensis]SMP28568.1 nicotinate-nucleotide adenylyltransferase [Shimia sagamensis]
MPYGLPYVARGQKIGLLGGSFDPPHAGHVHITKEALKRFGLDQVWWLVSPGNPLKDRGPAKLARRLAAAREIMAHPRVHVSDFESHVGTRYTAETLAVLQDKCPQARFVWLMGADNLAQFHRWKDWQDIMARVPVGVLARPGDRIEARTAKAAQVFRTARLHPKNSRALSRAHAPAWAFANVPMQAISSTELRKNGSWPKG